MVAVADCQTPLASKRHRGEIAHLRPPVLLLRSFKDDMLRLKPPWFRRNRGKSWSFEELLTGQLWCQGPVIAIGRPGEAAPPIGAARDYFSGEKWQAEAERLARDADTIVMLVGVTEGLGWEMRRIQDLQMLSKLILVFPPVIHAESLPRWSTFCRHVAGLPMADSLASLPSPNLLMVVFPDTSEFVAFTVADRRDPQAYQLGLGAAIQMRARQSCPPGKHADSRPPMG